MNTLIIYDTLYGNTEKIAEAISKGFPSTYKIKVLPVEKTTLDDLKDIELLIVGSPTHGGNTKPSLQSFLKLIPSNSLKEVKVCTFDTRFLESRLNLPLRLLVKTIGYAANKIAKVLVKNGGILIWQPEGFYVKDQNGPLLDGELERATYWAKDIHKKMS